MFVNVRLLRVSIDSGLNGFGFFLRVLRAFRGWVFVGVGMFHRGLFAGLHGFDCSGAWVFAVMFLFVNDFLVVGNIAWIRHRQWVRGWCPIRLCPFINGVRFIVFLLLVFVFAGCATTRRLSLPASGISRERKVMFGRLAEMICYSLVSQDHAAQRGSEPHPLRAIVPEPASIAASNADSLSRSQVSTGWLLSCYAQFNTE